MAKKDKVIEILEFGRQEVLHFAAALSDEQRAAMGAMDRWSAKDVVAHLTEWVVRLAHDLDLAEQPEATRAIPPNYDNIDETNAEIYAQYQALSWDEVLAEMKRSFAAVREYALAATDLELDNPHRVPWREGRPLWRMLVGTAVEHPILHLGYYHIGQGNLSEAARLQETSASRLLELDDTPTWRGAQTYNIACIQALSGQKEKSLVNLAEAFRLNPELIEWSKQDPDLVGLHQDPDFQRLHVVV